MKQVWQTEDGNVFGTKEAAERHLTELSERADLADFILEHCEPRYNDAEDIAATLIAHYNISPK